MFYLPCLGLGFADWIVPGMPFIRPWPQPTSPPATPVSPGLRLLEELQTVITDLAEDRQSHRSSASFRSRPPADLEDGGERVQRDRIGVRRHC